MFSKNLKYLRTSRSLTQEQLAEELGYKRSMYKDYEYGKEPDIAGLLKISEFFAVSLDELLKRDLESLAKIKLKNKTQSIDKLKDFRVLAVTVDKDEKENIEYVPVKAKAGYTAGYSDPVFISELRKFNLPHPQLARGTFRAFEISGDSMLPISNGTIVIAKYVESWREIANLKTYILVTKDDGIVYKRVINKIKDKKTLILMSDNPLYEPYIVNIEDILEVWAYHAHLSFSNVAADSNINIQVLAKLQELDGSVENIDKVLRGKMKKR